MKLTRISHHLSTATAQWHALPGVHSVGVLNRLISMPARSSVANAGQTAPLNRLATNGGKKCGLSTRLLFGATLLFSSAAFASGSGVDLKSVELDRDTAVLKKGAETVFQVCMRCHNLKYIKYQQLTEVGFTQSEVDTLRGDLAATETLKASMPASAAKFHFGKQPPDLSLMGKARKGGPDYIYTLLTSYHANAEGEVDNQLFPGVRMPDVLSYTVYDQPEERKQLEQKAQEVARFLEWTADPKAPLRREIGVYVVTYFVLLSLLLYVIKRRIWKAVH